MKRERISGKVLQKAIVEEARRQGWLCAHFYAVETTNRGWVTPVAADGKGFPDLLLVRDRVIAIEVKGDGDSMKPDQKKWQQAFSMAQGTQFVIATPAKWADGTIDAILRAREIVEDELVAVETERCYPHVVRPGERNCYRCGDVLGAF